jgi:hypothetical protein
MRRSITCAVVGAVICGAICFVLGMFTAAGLYRGSAGDVMAATLAVATVLAVLGAMGGAFVGAIVGVLSMPRDTGRKPTHGSEADYDDQPPGC